jgi:Fe2+ or Zn2+ uptake regulation protein
MSSQSFVLNKILRNKGFSNTAVRQNIFESLQGKEPLTIQNIISSNPTIDRASVYRTIDLFEKIGVVQRLQIGWKYKIELTDQFHAHHHHVVCIVCGRIDNFSEPDYVESNVMRAASKLGYKPTSHQLEIRGLCPDCQTK